MDSKTRDTLNSKQKKMWIRKTEDSRHTVF